MPRFRLRDSWQRAGNFRPPINAVYARRHCPRIRRDASRAAFTFTCPFLSRSTPCSLVYSSTNPPSSRPPTPLPPDFFVILRKDLSFVSTDNSLKLQKRFDGHDDERLVGACEAVENPEFKSKWRWILFKKFDYTLRRPVSAVEC